MMSLLTELDSFAPPFLQIGQSYGLRRLRALRATKNSNAKCPKRASQNDFGTAFVPTGQPEITCVGDEVTRLISNPVLILQSEPPHVVSYNFSAGGAADSSPR